MCLFPLDGSARRQILSVAARTKRTLLRRSAFAFVLLAAFALPTAHAQQTPATAPPAAPTRVDASFFFGTIENVDSVSETFNADFYLLLVWDDPRLGGVPLDQLDSSTIWQPKVEVVNSRDIQQPWPPFFPFPEQPRPKLLSRFHGTFAAPMDLHDFPFDRQVLPVEIESAAYPTRLVVFDYLGSHHKKRGWTVPLRAEEVLGNSVRLPEWEIDAVQVRELDKYYSFIDATYSRYRIEIMVSRRSGFYIWKVMAIEALLVILSWVVFVLEPGEVANRLAVCVTLLLATVAFNYVVSEITPRVSYLTLLDWFLLGCFVMIFLAGLEAVIVYFLHRRGKGAAVARVDRCSMAAFPILFLLFNVLLWAPVLV